MRRLADELAAFFTDRDRLNHLVPPMKTPEPATRNHSRSVAPDKLSVSLRQIASPP
jgi:hypothetical protein